jgi:acyl-coenzyme A synthetase/AMP-(fatty) acid ligase
MWELIDRRAEATPEQSMLVDERDRALTFLEFRDRAERVAAGFQGMGIGEGTTVSWQLPTRIDTIVVSAALSRLGAVQNPIIHLYRQREVASLLRTTQAGWFVTPGIWREFDYSAMAAAILDEHTGPPFRVLDGYTVLPDGDPATLPPPPTDGDEVRWLYSTSGTTSEPKAVRHSDATLIAGGTGIALRSTLSPTTSGRSPTRTPTSAGQTTS